MSSSREVKWAWKQQPPGGQAHATDSTLNTPLKLSCSNLCISQWLHAQKKHMYIVATWCYNDVVLKNTSKPQELVSSSFCISQQHKFATAAPVNSWEESFDQTMHVTPPLWAFSYRRTHWPVATRQTLIWPSWEPLASSSESLLKATAMTAFSCIMKLPSPALLEDVKSVPQAKRRQAASDFLRS